MGHSRASIALILSLLAAPAGAEVWDYGQQACNQLWFMRNLIMDRAGYCFGSALGQALYDNAGCTGTDVRPGPAASRQVQKIQKLEQQIGCKVNTGQSRLDLPLMAQIRRLRDMPLPDNGGWACLGWKAAAVPLYDGYGAGAKAIGQIAPGDRVDFGFLPEGNRVAVVVSRGGKTLLGWKDVGVEASCTEEAG